MPNFYEAFDVQGDEFSNYGAFVTLEQAEQMARNADAPAIMEVFQPNDSSLFWVIADESELEARSEFEEVEVLENPRRYNPFPFQKCIRRAKARGVRSPGAYCGTVDRRVSGKSNPGHLQLLGRSGALSHTVLRDATEIGRVERVQSGWAAYDMQGHNHGDRYTSAWNAAKQLSLALPVGGSRFNPSLRERASETWKDLKHAVTKRSASKQALRRLQEAAVPVSAPMRKFGLGKKRNPEGEAEALSTRYGLGQKRNPLPLREVPDKLYARVTEGHDKDSKWMLDDTEDFGRVAGPFKTEAEALQAASNILHNTKGGYGHKDGLILSYYGQPKAQLILEGLRAHYKRNPMGDAESLYEDFHGRPAGEVVEVEYEEHEHETLTGLGDLCQLKIITPFKKDCVINVCPTKSPKDLPDPSQLSRDERIILSCSEDGKQLYFIGGDQSVDVEALGFGEDDIKDSMLLGVLYEVTYQAEKGFDKFQLTNYYHKLGEDTGVEPVLIYDPVSHLLKVSGGQYKVEAPGIIN